MAKHRPWHDWRPILQAQIEAGNRTKFDKKLDRALSGPYVRKNRKMIAELNDYQQPYTSMGQLDMALTLGEAWQKWKVNRYLNLCYKAINPVFTEKQKGGLMWRTTGSSAFFHARTNTRKKGLGGTLNKHLLATKNMCELAGVIGYGTLLSVARLGTQQLWASKGPKLQDYVVTKGGVWVPNTWIYYGMDINRKKGYFLKNDPRKNGEYHILVLRLIAYLYHAFPTIAWVNIAKVVKHMLDTYLTKVSQGLYKNSSAPPEGNFHGIRPEGKTLQGWEISRLQQIAAKT